MGLWARKEKLWAAAVWLRRDDRRRVYYRPAALLALTLFIGQMLSDNFHAESDYRFEASCS